MYQGVAGMDEYINRKKEMDAKRGFQTAKRRQKRGVFITRI